MSKIIKETEMSLVKPERRGKPHAVLPRHCRCDNFPCPRAVDAQYEIGAKAIVTDSYTGRTARYIASFRGISLRSLYATARTCRDCWR